MDLKDLENGAATANDTPQNAIKYLLNCLYVYQKGGKKGKGEDKALGYMGYVIAKNMLKEDRKSPSGLKPFATTLGLIKGLREPQRANSVLSSMGGTWENDYQDVDPDNYELPVSKEQEQGEDRVKIYLQAGGRDNPIPVGLAKNNQGQWKITGFSSLCMDVRKGKTAVGDF